MGKAQDRDRIDQRETAWYAAVQAVKPIVEQHGLTGYTTGTVFQRCATYTPADQHIEHIIRVADWFLENQEQ